MKKKVYILGFIFFLIDVISKIIVLKLDVHIELIKNFFSLDKTTNTGAAFSLFTGYTIALILIAIAVLIYIYKTMSDDIKTKSEFIGTSMLIGGIIGNLFDRIVYGKVIDFISFKFSSYYFPTFNFADSFIIIGIILIIIGSIRSNKNGSKSNRK